MPFPSFGFIMPATAIVISNDVPAAVKWVARAAKWALLGAGGRIQICDGVDDNVEMKAAVDALPNGGTLSLSEGAFTVSSAVRVDKAVVIEGRGLAYAGYGTKIEVAAGAQCSIFELGAAIFAAGHGYAIRDIYLRGDAGANGLIKVVAQLHDSEFKNLLFINTGAGTTYCFRASTADGGGWHGLNFIHCWFEVATYGVYLYGGTDNYFTACKFAQNWCGFFEFGAYRNALVGCEFHTQDAVGYYGYSSYGTRIVGGAFYKNNNGNHAGTPDIRLCNMYYASIVGNVFEHERQTWAIEETFACGPVTVAGNTLLNYPDPAYSLMPDSQVHISNNQGCVGIGETRTFRKTVNYNDTSPVAICSVEDGYAVTDVWVEVVTTFNDAGAALNIGDGGDPDGFLPAANIDLTTAGYYGIEADSRGAYLWDAVNAHARTRVYTGSDTVDCTITKTNGTQGVAIVYVKLTRIGG